LLAANYEKESSCQQLALGSRLYVLTGAEAQVSVDPLWHV